VANEFVWLQATVTLTTHTMDDTMDVYVDSPSSDSSSAQSSPQQAQSTLPDIVEFGDLHGEEVVSSHTSSMDLHEASEQCSHFSEFLASPGERARCSSKYTAMVTWAAKSRGAAVPMPANNRLSKKRKVCHNTFLLVPNVHLDFRYKPPSVIHAPFHCIARSFAYPVILRDVGKMDMPLRIYGLKIMGFVRALLNHKDPLLIYTLL
jgi:hypothetical protein